MKRLIYLVISLTFLTFSVVSSVWAGSQQNSKQDKPKVVTLDKEVVVDRDYFTASDVVYIYGTVNGDVYAAGGQVIVDGIINGDVLAAGGQVKISGQVTQDVRVAGGQITISGQIGRNLTVLGGNIEVTEAASLGGSVVGAGGNLSLDTSVPQDIVLGFGNITLANRVEGDVRAAAGNLILTPEAQISGDLTYWSESDVSLTQGATVSGEIVKKEIEGLEGRDLKQLREKAGPALAGFWVMTRIVGFLAALVTGLLFVNLAPKYLQKSTDFLAAEPWKSLGVGLLILFLGPVVVMFTFITLIGIPVGMILLFCWLVDLYLSKLVVSFWLGQFTLAKLGKKNKNLNLVFLVGLIVYSILYLIPVLGSFVKLFALVFGLGALNLTFKTVYTEARKKALV